MSVDLADDAADRLLRAADHLHAGFDLRLGAGHQRLDLAGRIGGALGKRAHFLGDDRKAAAAIAGARGLDAGIERKQVGLESNLVDDADDLADLLGRLLDIGHGADGLADHMAARLGGRAGRRHGALGDPAVGGARSHLLGKLGQAP